MLDRIRAAYRALTTTDTGGHITPGPDFNPPSALLRPDPVGHRSVLVDLPPTTMPTPPEHPYLAEWWPDTDASPWSVSIFDGKPRVDFDGTDDEPNFRLNAGLQVHPTGEHWPFILLDTEHATLLAAHLLAAVDHIEQQKGP